MTPRIVFPAVLLTAMASWLVPGMAYSQPTATDAVIEETEDAPPAGANALLLLPLKGPRGQTIGGEVRKALAKADVLLAPPKFEGKSEFGDAPEAYVEFARQTGLRGYVQGQVVLKKYKWILQLQVRSAHDGVVVSETTLESKSLPGILREIRKQGAEQLAPLIAKTQVVPKAEAVPVMDNTPPPAPEAVHTSAPSPLEARAGAAFVVRNFSYSDPVADSYEYALVPHSNVGLPMPVLQVRWFPGAHFTDDLWAHIGLDLAFRRSLFGNTLILGDSFATTFQEILYGLRGRVPLGEHELGVGLGLGTQSLTVEGDNGRPPDMAAAQESDPGILPDVTYYVLRVGLDARIVVEDWLYLYPSLYVRTASLSNDPGQIAEGRWFPHASADGFELSAAAGMNVTEELELIAGLEWRQYGFDMNVRQDEVFTNSSGQQLNQAVAGGATDRYIGGFATLRYVLPSQLK